MLRWSDYNLTTKNGVVHLLADLGHYTGGDIKDAIASYQKMSETEVTGDWSRNDQERLYERRCACPDIQHANTRKRHWDKNDFKIWSRIDGAPNGFVQFILDGFNYWSKYANVRATLTDNRSEADSYITYRRIDGPGRVQAWQVLPGINHTGPALEGRYDTSDRHGEVVVPHEFGHFFGLDHINGQPVMNPFLTSQTRVEAGELEIAEMVERYGSPNTDPAPDPVDPTPTDRILAGDVRFFKDGNRGEILSTFDIYHPAS